MDEKEIADQYKQISALKRKKVYPQRWKVSENEHRNNRRLLALFREYQHILQMSNGLDFDDLIVQTWTLFKRNPDIAAAWSDEFRWVEVDEFQDTSDLEYEILHLLAKTHQDICVFGDLNQWIYRWRGVDGHRVITRFQSDFPQYQQLPLQRNFRSTHVILGVARSLITASMIYEAELTVDRVGSRDPIRVHGCSSEQAELDYIARRVKEIHTSGSQWNSIAVLTRTNLQVIRLA